MRTTIIYPATAKHLEKYSSHDSDVIYESPEDYQQITLPWINASSFEMTVGFHRIFIRGFKCSHDYT